MRRNRLVSGHVAEAGGEGGPAQQQERTGMADTTSDVLLDTIHDSGVEVVFGMPGDGITRSAR